MPATPADDAKRIKDMDDAARLYEGLPQNRGLTRADYIRMEHQWGGHLERHPEKRQELASAERAAFLAERNETAKAGHVPPHREAQPGEELQGRIIGIRTFEGVKHVLIETGEPRERVLCQGEVKGAAYGKPVSITIDDVGRLVEKPVERAAKMPERAR